MLRLGRPRAAITAAVVGVGALTVLLWPGLARSADRVDVAVVGDGAVTQSSDEIARHVRELGRSVVVATVDPCDQAALERSTAGARSIVVSFSSAAVAACPGSLDGLFRGAATAVAVSQDDELRPGAVDARALVPPDPGARVGCAWWEPPAPAGAIANCEADGQIAVRDADGTLTVAGRDRFARVVAGALA